jgi:RNA polymerase sigma-70 factor (ECF subfamily)
MAAKNDPPRAFSRREALSLADALYNFARHLTGNAADGEDLVQETYARAFSAADQYRGTSMSAWLFRILRNVHVDLYRRQQNNPTRGGLDTVRPAHAHEPPSDGNLLRDDVELHQLRTVVAHEIEAALMTLSDDARTVILLDLEGLTEIESAEVLGCPVGTIKSRLARARATLRQRLKEYAK